MTKNKLVLVAIVLLFTIALVSVSFLDCKKVVGTSDQVVIDVDSESVKDKPEVAELGRKIIKDKNSECITWLSNKKDCDQVVMVPHNESDDEVLIKLKRVIVKDKNSECITWLSTQQLNKQKQNCDQQTLPRV